MAALPPADLCRPDFCTASPIVSIDVDSWWCPGQSARRTKKISNFGGRRPRSPLSDKFEGFGLCLYRNRSFVALETWRKRRGSMVRFCGEARAPGLAQLRWGRWPAKPAGWGVARRIGAGRLARKSQQNVHRRDPAFHTPSVAFGDTPGSPPGGRLFPAPEKEARGRSPTASSSWTMARSSKSMRQRRSSTLRSTPAPDFS